eukprot:Lithocolla_globosa_v1_NODE_2536_length_1962_cov_3.215522.p1 type:complete len:604 gc:universal NODE_2536_length_1962_cov_3.215522:72-1883(+)
MGTKQSRLVSSLAESLQGPPTKKWKALVELNTWIVDKKMNAPKELQQQVDGMLPTVVAVLRTLQPDPHDSRLLCITLDCISSLQVATERNAKDNPDNQIHLVLKLREHQILQPLFDVYVSFKSFPEACEESMMVLANCCGHISDVDVELVTKWNIIPFFTNAIENGSFPLKLRALYGCNRLSCSDASEVLEKLFESIKVFETLTNNHLNELRDELLLNLHVKVKRQIFPLPEKFVTKCSQRLCSMLSSKSFLETEELPSGKFYFSVFDEFRRLSVLTLVDQYRRIVASHELVANLLLVLEEPIYQMHVRVALKCLGNLTRLPATHPWILSGLDKVRCCIEKKGDIASLADGILFSVDKSIAHSGTRLVDSEVVEDGNFRNPLGGLFPSTLPVVSVSNALNPFQHRMSDFHRTMTIATKHARKISPRYPQLSLDECTAIVVYTMEEIPRQASIYYMMNLALREIDRTAVRPWRDYVWLLLNALRKLPVPRPDLVYRGIRLSPEQLGTSYQSGEEFQAAAFMSTSSQLSTMETFLGSAGIRTMYHMKLTEPVARDIADFSLFPTEYELLLPPNIMMRVEGILPLGNQLYMIQCTQTKTVDPLIQF